MDDSADPAERDIGSDLAEITGRLGEPDSTHHTSRGGVVWRFVVGVLMVVGSAVFHYLFWTEQIPWPAARHFKLWAFIIIAGLLGPGGGLALIAFAVRSMKMWVLTYPTGLFVWHRGQVSAYPWDDIVAVQFGGLPPKAKYTLLNDGDDPPELGWYDLEKTGGRLFGSNLTLERADGEEVTLPSVLEEFPALGERVQKETFSRLFPAMRDRLRAGASVEIVPVTFSPLGLTFGKKTLPWLDMDRIDRVGNELHIFQKGKKRPWKKIPLLVTKNLHVLMGLADYMMRQASPPAAEEPPVEGR